MDPTVDYFSRGLRLEVRAERPGGGPPRVRTIEYGRRAITVRNTGDGDVERYTLTGDDLKGLLHPPRALCAAWDGEKLRIGPAVAIYALPFPGKNLFGPQTAMFAEMSELCKRSGCDLYVVTPGSLHLADGVVDGYRIHEREWRKQPCPWPDFVWRRLTVRPEIWARQLDEDERLIAGSNTHVGTLARSGNDKWQVFRALRGDPRTARHLPETVLVHSPQEAARVTDRFDDMYVKPIRGTQGQGVMRVRKTAAGFLVAPPSAAGGRMAGAPMKDAAELSSALGRRMGPRQAYLAQETVQVMRTAAGRPFDLRILVQALADGSTACTAVVARVGRPGAVTTNLHTGGVPVSVLTLTSLLAHDGRRTFARAAVAARDAALAAFDVLAELHPHLMELGVDIALNANGNAYILEVNPCPGRRMLRQIDPALRRMSLVRVVEYAVFSAGFRPL